MNDWSVLIWNDIPGFGPATLRPWLAHPAVRQAWLLEPASLDLSAGPDPQIRVERGDAFVPGRQLEKILRETGTDYLVVQREAGECAPGEPFFRRLEQSFAALRAGCLYSHWRRTDAPGQSEIMLPPRFQPGSARDTFPFGPILVFRMDAVRRALDADGPLADTRGSGLMELIYRLARRGAITLTPECLYDLTPRRAATAEEERFDYVRRENLACQRELEQVFTAHLERLGARLDPPRAALPPPPDGTVFPVVASVVIPVRDRVHTVGQAIESAATQETDFPCNVLVVDNFSSDGTAAVIAECARKHSTVCALTPPAPGRGIGGCWQWAVTHPRCGRYAVQLDSDDLYASPRALQQMVDAIRDSACAMAVGSYRVVDASLAEIPPGIVNHREWTDDNGPNNLLRVEGIGAPRGFDVTALRTVGFPDVSYGEDYAVALALSSRYRLARIFEPVYLCRRWDGNSDSRLSPALQAAHHEYKDFLRTCEISRRQNRNP